MDQLIKLLKNNARITNSELAVLLDKSEEQVAADIAMLEADGVIKGYSAIVDESAYDPNSVFALIELKVTPQSQSGFKCKYLLDPLKVIKEDKVKLQMSGSLLPMKIVPCEGDAYTYLVLPVRLAKE